MLTQVVLLSLSSKVPGRVKCMDAFLEYMFQGVPLRVGLVIANCIMLSWFVFVALFRPKWLISFLLFQSIIVYEYLPALLGRSLPEYKGN